jgi:quercetin dioxygenase-like cupin family protein
VPDPSPSLPATINLAAEIAALEHEPSYRESGHAAKTVVRNADTRVVLFALRAGAHLPEHKTNHGVIVHTLAGHVQIHLPAGPVEVAARSLLVLGAGVPHDVLAKEDSAVLLTIIWPPSQ